MADTTDSAQETATAGNQPARAEPRLKLSSQYIKDLSFENPNAPQIYSELTAESGIDVTINVDLTHMQDRLYEVVLSISVKANAKERAAFVIELEFAGLATPAQRVPDEEVEHLMLTEVPRHLFPFARAIIGDVTRDGGFPPLLINPIDFEELFRHRQETDRKLADAGAN
ncbi:MAG: protein-export chaperone SecB [Pseudomonadota bacterium]